VAPTTWVVATLMAHQRAVSVVRPLVRREPLLLVRGDGTDAVGGGPGAAAGEAVFGVGCGAEGAGVDDGGTVPAAGPLLAAGGDGRGVIAS
jgi:hypothetical protein